MTPEELAGRINLLCAAHKFTQEDGPCRNSCILADGIPRWYFTLTSAGPKEEGATYRLWYSNPVEAVEAFESRLYSYAKLQPRIVWRSRPELVEVKTYERFSLYQVSARLITTDREAK